MNIIYIAQYFNLPHEAGASRHYAFATELQKKGHRVTVITGSQNYRTGLIPDNYKGRLFTREEIDGVNVIKTYVYANYKQNFKKRLLNHFSFMLMAIVAGLMERKIDVVFASSTPLFVGISGWLSGLFRRAPFVFEVRDLWPESAVALGILKNDHIIKASKALEGFLYKRAEKIIAVTSGIRDGMIKHGVDANKIELITNGVDLDIYDHIQGQKKLRKELGLDGKFVCIYVGAHGMVNNLSVILNAANELKTNNDITFMLIGDGDNKPNLLKMKQDMKIGNVTFVDPLPKAMIPTYLSMADVCLLSLRSEDIFKGMFPNKIFDYLASSTPTIVAAQGESQELIEQAQAGMVVEPDNFKAMSKLILKLYRMPAAERIKMGQNGRDYVLKHYRRSDLADKLSRILHEVVNG